MTAGCSDLAAVNNDEPFDFKGRQRARQLVSTIARFLLVLELWLNNASM